MKPSASLKSTGEIVVRLARERVALRLPARAIFTLAVPTILLVLTIFLCAVLGTQNGEFGGIWGALLGDKTDVALHSVIWEFRLPRAMAAAVVGAMFALSGATLQIITRNGLADPSLIGISQGAAFGVILVTVAWPGAASELRPVVAFCGSLTFAFVIQGLAWSPRGTSTVRFVLLGVAVASLISAATSVFMTYGNIERVVPVLAWLSGSINATGWSDVSMLTSWLIVLGGATIAFSRSMSSMLMGSEISIALGNRLPLSRLAIVMLAVGLASMATAVVGPIGFVGLLAPHAARRLARSGVGLHLLITATTGAIMVCVADLIGRVIIAPVQLPAGLIIDLVGVPLFMLLFLRTTRLRAL